MVHERIKALRESLERRTKETKAKARARERSRTRGAKAREKAERERRIERGNPNGLKEEATAAVQQAKAAKAAASGAVSAERQFLSQELGVSTEEAGKAARQAIRLFERANASGIGTGAFDLDGDGDTDLLQAVDQPVQAEERGQPISIDPTEPILDISGTMDDPLFNDVEAVDIDPSQPSPGEIGFDG